LIENSIKFRKKGQINDVSINGEKKSGKILFQISDSGQGISKDVSSRIYHMFFRGNENSNGSGLGLYIVKNAVEKLKGTIKLDESYKKGARFILSIPTAAKVRIPKVL
ncbi:MAG: HAMP domain-containing sensor histidine kinase, partial [Bacteroidota bacterium]